MYLHEKIDMRLCAAKLAAAAVAFICALIFGGTAGKVLFCVSLLLAACDLIVAAVKHTRAGVMFDEYMLISAACVYALIIGQFAVGAAAAIIYQLGELLRRGADMYAKRTVSHLQRLRPDTVRVLTEGIASEWEIEKVAVGAAITVACGETVPLDGVVRGGSSALDTSPLTGPAEPVTVSVGDKICAGCVNTGAALTIEVTKTYEDSTVARLLETLKAAAETKSDIELFADRLASWLTPVLVVAAILLEALPPLISGGENLGFIDRAMVLLALAGSSSLTVAAPIAYFAGMAAATKKGVFTRSANAFDALAEVHTAVFDKTGTLTDGSAAVTEVLPADGIAADALLMLAAYAEQGSDHPIARAITRAWGGKVEQSRIDSHAPVAGGVHMVMRGNSVYVGSDRLMRGKDIKLPNEPKDAVFVAVNGVYAGAIVVSDELKNDAEKAVRELKALGAERTVLMTGGCEEQGRQTAEKLGIDVDFCGLLPDEKAVEMEKLNAVLPSGRTMIFTGDGINDAPVKAIADAVIMLGGMDKDTSEADIVIMGNDPERIPEAVRLARGARRTARINLALALGVKAAFVVLALMGIAPLWLAVTGEAAVCAAAIAAATHGMVSK